MQAGVKSDFMSVADYLVAEEASQVRHEYLGGLVYAMAGETRSHDRILGNLYLRIRRRLNGEGCQVYASDVRVKFHLHPDEYYYYPDIVVACDKRDPHLHFVHFPKLIIEVLSESTERVDKREKFFACTSIASLQEYVLVAPDQPEVTVFRRKNQWKSESLVGAKARLALESLDCSLPVSAIYEGV